MGGWEHGKRRGHAGPTLRRAAPPPPPLPLLVLVPLMALAVLLGGVIVCGGGQQHPHRSTSTAAAEHHPDGPAGAHVDCVTPEDLPGCSPHAPSAPAVLPVPPPALALADGVPVPAARPAYAGPVRAPGALARAPDLHALQVLRN